MLPLTLPLWLEHCYADYAGPQLITGPQLKTAPLSILQEGFDQADSRRQLVPLQHIAVGAMARGLPTVLGSLFKILLAEIEALITFGEKQDH